MSEVTGKVAVVTGASRGIGLEIVARLAASGYSVAACSRKLSGELEAAIAVNPHIKFFVFDLEAPETLKDTAQAIFTACDRVDALVNCAGIASGGLFAMQKLDDLKHVFDVNYFHQIVFTQYIAKKMVRAKAGSIINIASTAGLLSDPGTIAYGGSKAALIHATRVMARELGAFNIRVNAIAPSVVETDMAGEMDEAAKSKLDERSALKGLIGTGDVADLALFLASDTSAKMTGQVLRLDRGLA